MIGGKQEHVRTVSGGGDASATDADLVRAARCGEAAALGLLLARHRAGMYAVAVSLLGYVPEAEDAVQDGALTAVRHIGDLRDPEAASSWLRAVVRNACLDRLRRRPAPEPVDLADLARMMKGGPGPEETLDRHVLRDWVWQAVGELTPPLRMVTMLRYFTDVTDYESIAVVCGIPVGTVRSRLSQARAKLAEALGRVADTAHDDIGALTRARRGEAEELLGAVGHGRFQEVIDERFSPTLVGLWPNGQRTRGTDFLVRALDGDLAAGVGCRLSNVVTGGDVLIWEVELINPSHDPFHCPPGVVWLQTLRDGRVQRLRTAHRPRPEKSPF